MQGGNVDMLLLYFGRAVAAQCELRVAKISTTEVADLLQKEYYSLKVQSHEKYSETATELHTKDFTSDIREHRSLLLVIFANIGAFL